MWINYTNFCWKSWLISEFIISKWWINDSTRRLILNHYHKLILWLTTNHQAQRIERQIITNANLNFSSLSQQSFQKLNHLFWSDSFSVTPRVTRSILFFDRFFKILFSAMTQRHWSLAMTWKISWIFLFSPFPLSQAEHVLSLCWAGSKFLNS